MHALLEGAVQYKLWYKKVCSKQQTIEDESHLECIKNQSHHSNIKIMGAPEDSNTERTWDDVENVVKN